MGILNLTPDSFFTTVAYSTEEAIERVFEMADEGADIIDIGGESTRPGATPVSPEEEISRIIDVIRETAPSLSVPISVDTMHPETAEAALDAGASIINDVGGLRDDKMMRIVSSAGVPVVVMHMHGTPETMQLHTMQGNVIQQISDFFDETITKALNSGVKERNIILDPGIGFGKTFQQNIDIIENLRKMSKGHTLLTGTSMKSFLSHAYSVIPRRKASVLSAVMCVKNGADIVRVHNVKGTATALRH
ncbi:MAG: dihydropteroate synthase [Methanomassiliicoccaceae archaeon]|nr:dihydropteroate synthase [Methanomassiliicoccaceae archaeon]